MVGSPFEFLPGVGTEGSWFFQSLRLAEKNGLEGGASRVHRTEFPGSGVREDSPYRWSAVGLGKTGELEMGAIRRANIICPIDSQPSVATVASQFPTRESLVFVVLFLR